MGVGLEPDLKVILLFQVLEDVVSCVKSDANPLDT